MKYKLPFIETKTKISGYLKKEKEKKEKALSRKRELWIKGIFYEWFFKPMYINISINFHNYANFKYNFFIYSKLRQ